MIACLSQVRAIAGVRPAERLLDCSRLLLATWARRAGGNDSGSEDD